ncbi:SCNM1 protein, partial [Crypturellus soui]|nr:SCNM1 protein [Crypturellus soui]
MSFKREGDDAGQLGALQKRRVADLLASFIPEEEALLLRSGRYACTVCPHRPVFDTLAVLTVHRAGKKHQAGKSGCKVPSVPPCPPVPCVPMSLVSPTSLPSGLQSFYGAAAPLLARTRRIAQSALLKAAPYSSRCRRSGVDGSGSRAATRAPSATPVAAAAHPEPGISSPKDTAAVEATSAALLPGQRGRRAGERSPSARGVPSASPMSPSPPCHRPLRVSLSAGWIQDSSGKWVKDENAEFDSDEDEPP